MGHKEMSVWKESIILVTMIYKFTEKFPKSETYGLVSQLRRAAVSIPTNIAEGSGRNGFKELHQFIGISMGSASELETLVIISKELNYAKENTDELDKQLESVRKLLVGYKNYVKKMMNK